jgi:hypothetical protein
MTFAIIFMSLIVVSTLVGITFGIYGYATDKLWERNAKNLKGNDWEESFAKFALRGHYQYIGFRLYHGWDTNTDKSHRAIYFQFLDKCNKELVRWNTKEGLW